jgi:starch phosphorylase
MNSTTPAYPINPKYSKSVAYFSMEFAIDQALKTYSGGLGYLAGSHMRSVYDLKQNVVGIGMLWKYGYYDQVRNKDNSLGVLFQEKNYTFLEDTGIVVPVRIFYKDVLVKAMYLKPEVFGTAPMYFLTTDISENDYLSQTITHKLYDAHLLARLAQQMVLGIGGAKVIDALGLKPEIYHMNEAHALPLAFNLYTKYRNVEEVKKRVVFTTHTPEEAGNDKNEFKQLSEIGFFDGIDDGEVRNITGTHENLFNHSLVALRLAHVSNAVSKIHGVVSNDMWKNNEGICQIKSITNAQNKKYWVDAQLEAALKSNDDKALTARKIELKKDLFKIVADQTGNIFDPNVLTIVWARRFAGYKRPSLLTRNFDKFLKLVKHDKQPVQIIWAGKPYPEDHGSINEFNYLVGATKGLKRCAILTGYELGLSAALKKGSDVWLNNPRFTREASGTSGMTAAMNASINFSIADGWVPEFSKHGVNSFVIPHADHTAPLDEQDEKDYNSLMKVLVEELIPTYYKEPKKWLQIIKTAMLEVAPEFDSDRMADEYYKEIYNHK